MTNVAINMQLAYGHTFNHCIDCCINHSNMVPTRTGPDLVNGTWWVKYLIGYEPPKN